MPERSPPRRAPTGFPCETRPDTRGNAAVSLLISWWLFPCFWQVELWLLGSDRYIPEEREKRTGNRRNGRIVAEILELRSCKKCPESHKFGGLRGKRQKGCLRSRGPASWAMKGPLLPVSRDRRISDFPKCYTPEACLQLREDFHAQVRAACQRRNPGTVGLKISKVVVVGDLCVGKTSLINRFCKEVFDRDYKATIGVDFEIERFEIAGVPYNLQIWDTAGQEKFKCIASAYYRGAEVIITVFDLADIQTLDHTKRWLEDALRENHPGSSFVFLVGTKKDLLVSLKKSYLQNQGGRLGIPSAAQYWTISLSAGENVKDFFFRVAALAFERSVLMELEKSCNRLLPIGTGDFIRIEENAASSPGSRPSNLNCC
ncbi:ras-related protein Rab-36 [Notechis scutatus]|uniref:Ras-related protein Rab-36 n=1 Tax=Notechis scutatus TaxID=8663 RepID=A0A6J1VDL1_9SAUR|nr:ras-related protein Rab-36 [Notechis scutatus]